MPDIDNSDGSDKDQVEDKGTDNSSDTDTTDDDGDGSKDQDTDDDGGAGDDGATKDDDKSDDGKKSKDDKKSDDKSDDDDEPPVRKSKKDFIIDRLQKKNAKLSGKQNQKSGSDDDGANDDDDKGGDTDDADIDARIDQRLAERDAEKAARDEMVGDIDAFIEANPQFKQYRDKAIKWADKSDSPYALLPADRLLFAVAGKDLVKLGAKMKAQADQEADQSKVGGSAGRDTEGGKTDVWKMSKAEFEAKKNEVLHGKRK